LRFCTLAERPDLRRAYYDLLVEVVPEVPGDEPPEMIAWDAWCEEMDCPAKRAEACFFVLDEREDDRVVGIGELEFSEMRPGAAWHGFTAVARSHRGRGVARALKRRTILYARESGLHTLYTENEERNAPIRHINRVFGYTPVPAGLVFRGPIARA
jgi:RimJ/RimL family protein N-acetyltransferase